MMISDDSLSSLYGVPHRRGTHLKTLGQSGDRHAQFPHRPKAKNTPDHNLFTDGKANTSAWMLLGC
ncbi:MAG: hypothetical protein JRJ38_04510 [Deltaproteobacteria bacterium]|nr:hypothetical protein [Deltaproteobacteria bacterium]